MKPCDKNIIETFEIVERMIELADRGDADREDTGCGILYGVIRDSAYKIKKLAEHEKSEHIKKGWWRQVPPLANHGKPLKKQESIY